MNDKQQQLDELIKRFRGLDEERRKLLYGEYTKHGFEGRVIFDFMPEATQQELKRLSREMDEVRKQGMSLEEEIDAEEEE
jgi:hypothetical protein